MPEYLAPGVYIEETSYRSKSIEGVSTTTTGFIGPTRYGPIDLDPEIVTSLEQFERRYGDEERLDYSGDLMDNYMWHAARGFFIEGGRRLYISRVFQPLSATKTGRAETNVGGVTLRARYPGAYGNFTIWLTLKSGRNLLGREDDGTGNAQATLGAIADNDVVWIRTETGSPSFSPPGAADFALARRDATGTFKWKFHPLGSPSQPLQLSGSPASNIPGAGESVRIVTLTLEVQDRSGRSLGTWADLPLDPAHRTGGRTDSLFAVFNEDRDTLTPIIALGSGISGLDVLWALFGASNPADGAALEKGIRIPIMLQGGDDGKRPGPTEYEGEEVEPQSPAGAESYRTGLKQFEALEDISIVAAPGSTWDYENTPDEVNATIGLLLAHARNMAYRIAVIDSAQKQSISDVRKMRAKIDSKYAALYFPWVKVFDPVTRRTISLPPSGFVAGIYARNDVNRAVFKAPANEVVNLAIGFEMLLSKPQQEVLNPEGINCFRFFEGRGMLLWGARTISSDPEWKYVSLRRYMAYLERSIDLGTQWAVFEPNGERLWANVRRTIEDFLLNEWQMGAMLGDKPEKAFFVKCDRGTMSQNDLDNGRLVCKIGVAIVKPAEFVIFRIGQWTADHKI